MRHDRDCRFSPLFPHCNCDVAEAQEKLANIRPPLDAETLAKLLDEELRAAGYVSTDDELRVARDLEVLARVAERWTKGEL